MPDMIKKNASAANSVWDTLKKQTANAQKAVQTAVNTLKNQSKSTAKTNKEDQTKSKNAQRLAQAAFVVPPVAAPAAKTGKAVAATVGASVGVPKNEKKTVQSQGTVTNPIAIPGREAKIAALAAQTPVAVPAATPAPAAQTAPQTFGDVYSWGGFSFFVKPKHIRGINGIGFSASCETEDSESDGEKFAKKKNNGSIEAEFTAVLNALFGEDVQTTANSLLNAARTGQTGYIYMRGQKVHTCEFMCISASIDSLQTVPSGQWLSCEVAVKLKQCSKYGGGTTPASAAPVIYTTEAKTTKNSSTKKTSQSGSSASGTKKDTQSGNSTTGAFLATVGAKITSGLIMAKASALGSAARSSQTASKVVKWGQGGR